MAVEALQTRLKVIEDEILRLAKTASQESERAQQDNLLSLASDLQCEARDLRSEINRESIDQTFSPILLYDGVCGFCNRVVQFTLHHDRHAMFRFAPLQSPLAARILARHGVNSGNLDTFFVVVNPNLIEDRSTAEYLLSRSDAVIYVLQQLGGWGRAASLLLRLIPKFLRNLTYNMVAGHRYSILGRSEICPVPGPKHRTRFLDLPPKIRSTK